MEEMLKYYAIIFLVSLISIVSYMLLWHRKREARMNLKFPKNQDHLHFFNIYIYENIEIYL